MSTPEERLRRKAEEMISRHLEHWQRANLLRDDFYLRAQQLVTATGFLIPVTDSQMLESGKHGFKIIVGRASECGIEALLDGDGWHARIRIRDQESEERFGADNEFLGERDRILELMVGAHLDG